MGRASYNSLMDSTLLHEHLLSWPVNWPDIFGRQGPLLVEIGFGGGHFLVDLAQKRPFANLLGVEISLPSIVKTQRKIQTAGLANVRLLQCSARYLLQALCEAETVAEIYINFPDPWPKSRHHHRRLISPAFLHLLATRMPPAGLLEIATDHADYAAAITEALTGTPYFSSRLAGPYQIEDSRRRRTKYEQLALDEGRACCYYKWRRTVVPAPNIFPIPKELPMPHAVLHVPLGLDAIQENYGPWEVSGDECRVSFMTLFRAHEGQMLLVETYIHEDPVSQRLGLMIRQREPDNFVISLHELGFPRPTAGVHLAIGHLAAWLLGLSHASRIVHHNLQTALLGAALNHAA